MRVGGSAVGGTHDRNVLRWAARRALLDSEIARLEWELTRAQGDPARAESLALQLADARARRMALGPTPQPKMG